MLEGGDGKGELSHWVEVVGAAVNQLLDEAWDVGAGSPLSREVAYLLLAWDFASKKEPEETWIY